MHDDIQSRIDALARKLQAPPNHPTADPDIVSEFLRLRDQVIIPALQDLGNQLDHRMHYQANWQIGQPNGQGAGMSCRAIAAPAWTGPFYYSSLVISATRGEDFIRFSAGPGSDLAAATDEARLRPREVTPEAVKRLYLDFLLKHLSM
jgi:hypothetical protein